MMDLTDNGKQKWLVDLVLFYYVTHKLINIQLFPSSNRVLEGCIWPNQ